MRDPSVTPSHEAEFWKRVAKGTDNECWLWTGSLEPSFGYGRLWTGGRRGRHTLAHRLSWTINRGPIPDGQEVCHECDNPPCVNPRHLFLGSQTDNMADMRRKGRGSPPPLLKGELARTAKLNEEKVRAIRAEWNASGKDQRAIAKKFGVSQKAVWSVVNRRSWAHVAALLLVLGALCASERGAAEPARVLRLHLSAADRVLAARVIANEDSRVLRPESDGGTAGNLTMDSYGILQVVHDVAREQGWSHARALRALAPHVTGLRPPTQRRHALYGSLPAFGMAQPLAWTDVDGPWSVYAPNWARLRAGIAKVIALGFPAPSAVPLLAWGMDQDASIAASRGLVEVQLPGGEAANHFYARGAISAAQAKGAGR